jgi:spore germination protein KB
MERISQSQLAAMIVLFQIGSSPLFLLASEAGADAWISVLIGMIGGLLLLLLVTLQLYRRMPEEDLFDMIERTFGKVAGSLLTAVYIVYFGYKAVRNVREFGDLMILYLLPSTPLWFILLTLLVVAAYAVFQGIEVFSRVAQILLPMIVFIYVALFVALWGTALFDAHRLMPVLDDGLKKPIESAFPELISFPFGEMVLFLLFWKYADRRGGTTRTTVLSYLFSGTFIVVTTIFILGSLGPLAEFSVVPLIQIVSLVQTADFIQRLDPIVALLLFGGVFMKMTSYYLGTTLLFSRLFRIGRFGALFPVGVLLFAGALAFRSYMQHIWFGFEKNLKYHFPIFQIVIPVLLLLAVMIRSRFEKNGTTPS